MAWNQNSTGTVGSVTTLQSFWFIKSDWLGKVSVGTQSPAGGQRRDPGRRVGLARAGQLGDVDNSSFFPWKSGGAGVGNGATWGDIGFCHHIGLGIGGDCNGVPTEVVRNTARLAPGSPGWPLGAQDDMWDVAARYAGEWN